MKIAVTFHAFARRIVYNIGGFDKCGKILAAAKEDFVRAILITMGVERKQLDEMTKLMSLFINRAQQRYLGGEAAVMVRHIAGYLSSRSVGERERKFVEMGLDCYKRYHWYLLNAGPRSRLAGGEFSEYGTDFNLIMSWAAKIIRERRADELIGGKKYILIDEYQDFSQLFLSVIQAIRSVVDAKLFVVGDDWQAINRFAGSDVEYFKDFEKFFDGDTRRFEITTNYRCDAEIVEMARRFMRRAMDERGNFRAKSRRSGKVVVVNPKRTSVRIAFTDHDARVSVEDLIYQEAAWRMLHRAPKKKTVQYVKTLLRIIRENRKAKEILLLHRNNETGLEGATLVRLGVALRWGAIRLGVMSGADFDVKVQLMTMHKSKGLEAEVVIILEADEGVIPKVHPDTQLFAVFGETDEVALDDQKRLFYVAMPRAKKRLYIIHAGSKKAGEGFIKYLGKGVERDF